jgi:hypothetical protein
MKVGFVDSGVPGVYVSSPMKLGRMLALQTWCSLGLCSYGELEVKLPTYL